MSSRAILMMKNMWLEHQKALSKRRVHSKSGQPSPRSLAKLVEKTGLARSTVMVHLNHLETNSLLTKEEILQGKVGRPKVLYKPTVKLLEEIETD